MSQPDEIKWESPGLRNRGRGRLPVWIPVLKPLVQYPGRWALVREADTSGAAHAMSANIRLRRVLLPPGHWEATARGRKVYARYMGEDQ